MDSNRRLPRKLTLKCVSLLACLTACSGGRETGGMSASGLRQPEHQRAGGVISSALDQIHSLEGEFPPAPVRPDPDLHMRNLLRQFRPEGQIIAREIGRVEEYRMLLGGASEDFQTLPQDTFDATSLLALLKVVEEVCEGLVNPTASRHPGWKTILPHAASERTQNIRFLAQRLTGKPSSSLPSALLQDLEALAQSEASRGLTGFAVYVAPCVGLATDAEALLL